MEDGLNEEQLDLDDDETTEETNDDYEGESNPENMAALMDFLANPNVTVSDLLSLNLANVSEPLITDLLPKAESLLSSLTYEQLTKLTPANTPQQLGQVIIKLLKSKFTQLNHQQVSKTITNLITKAEQAQAEDDLEELSDILEQLKIHENNEAYYRLRNYFPLFNSFFNSKLGFNSPQRSLYNHFQKGRLTKLFTSPLKL